jgi:two-component system sensor histidine kinase KdpD
VTDRALVRRLLVAFAAVALITATLRYVSVNPTTVALSYVVLILVMSSQWGVTESMVVSIAAALCFNFFFLPPVGTLTIYDPQNVVAVLTFLLTAIVVSQLAGRARRRQVEAEARRQDLERLYALSRSLLLADTGVAVQVGLAQRIAEAFGLSGVALYDAASDVIARGGADPLPEAEMTLRDVARSGVSFRDLAGTVAEPIHLGGLPIGSLVVAAPAPAETVMQSIANLAAIGLERARSIDAAARGEAARQSGELRATVMDALAHEFKTPLTSMKAAATDLASSSDMSPHERELATIIGEELERLQALVSDAVQMLRIDAGQFVVRRERQNVEDLVRLALKPFSSVLDGHRVSVSVAPGLQAEVDGDLLKLGIRQLLDNAVKYSPSNSSIDLSAGGGDGIVWIAVKNSGTIVALRDRPRLFDRFYRGVDTRNIPGTGMGLAIVKQIVAAHGGTVHVSSDQGMGTAFTLSLPSGVGAR